MGESKLPAKLYMSEDKFMTLNSHENKLDYCLSIKFGKVALFKECSDYKSVIFTTLLVLDQGEVIL